MQNTLISETSSVFQLLFFDEVPSLIDELLVIKLFYLSKRRVAFILFGNRNI